MAKRGSHLSKIKYEPSDELAEIVGSADITRAQMVKKIWVYIKKHDLQDPDNGRIIVPDDVLGDVIGHKPIDMLKMQKKFSEHLTRV